MAKTENEVRAMHRGVKLLLTMLVGGLFAIVTFFFVIDALATVMPRPSAGPLSIAIVVLVAASFASFLYLREKSHS